MEIVTPRTGQRVRFVETARAGLLRFSVLWAAFAAIGLPAHAQVPPKAPWAITPESAVPISVPAEVRRAIASLDYDDTEPIRGVAADLNGDGVDEYVLQSAERLCGNGGCVYVLIDGATRRKVGEFFGSPLVVRAERAHGYPNIATYSHQSAESGDYTEYGFDGTVYEVESARRVEGAAASRLFDELRLVPIWRPRK